MCQGLFVMIYHFCLNATHTHTHTHTHTQFSGCYITTDKLLMALCYSKNVFSLFMLLAWTLFLSLYRLLRPPSYVFSKQIGSVTKWSWEVYNTCSIGIDSAGCCFQQAALYRTAKVIETVYPLARCAKLDALDFSCAAAPIADSPPLNTPQGISIHQGLLEGKKSRRRGEGVEKSFQTWAWKQKRVSSSEIAGTWHTPWLLTCSCISFLATQGNENACGHHKFLWCGIGYSNIL